MFRRGANDKNMIFKSLPQKMYPEYHRIHKMMARGREHEADYQPLERQHIIEIFEVSRGGVSLVGFSWKLDNLNL